MTMNSNDSIKDAVEDPEFIEELMSGSGIPERGT